MVSGELKCKKNCTALQMTMLRLFTSYSKCSKSGRFRALFFVKRTERLYQCSNPGSLQMEE